MKPDVLIERARSALGKATVYASPGRMPALSAPMWPAGARIDCSGFVCWCLRFSATRRVDHPLYRRINGGWFETSAVHRDGLEPTGYFRQLQEAQPGALLVYPDYVDTAGASRQGHIGIVLAARGVGVKGVREVIHCSAGNFRRHADAIRITDARAWKARAGSLILWYEGLEDSAPG